MQERSLLGVFIRLFPMIMHVNILIFNKRDLPINLFISVCDPARNVRAGERSGNGFSRPARDVA